MRTVKFNLSSIAPAQSHSSLIFPPHIQQFVRDNAAKSARLNEGVDKVKDSEDIEKEEIEEGIEWEEIEVAWNENEGEEKSWLEDDEGLPKIWRKAERISRFRISKNESCIREIKVWGNGFINVLDGVEAKYALILSRAGSLCNIWSSNFMFSSTRCAYGLSRGDDCILNTVDDAGRDLCKISSFCCGP